MSAPFFRVIIPCFNTEQYIEQCLDSIFSQTFADFKVIAIDDLSTDRTWEILQQYATRYPDKMQAIRVKEKSYAGTCRNLGITYETDAQYTLFADSDDYYPHAGVFQRMRELILENNDPDMLFFQYWSLKNSACYRTPTYDVNTAYQQGIMLLNCTCAPWARVVKSTQLHSFENGLNYGEDAIQLLKIMDSSSNVVVCNEQLYTYRDNSEGITQRIVRQEEKALRQLKIFQDGLERMLPTVKKRLTKINIVAKLGCMYQGLL